MTQFYRDLQCYPDFLNLQEKQLLLLLAFPFFRGEGQQLDCVRRLYIIGRLEKKSEFCCNWLLLARK